jgi:hypothetical protein
MAADEHLVTFMPGATSLRTPIAQIAHLQKRFREILAQKNPLSAGGFLEQSTDVCTDCLKQNIWLGNYVAIHKLVPLT